MDLSPNDNVADMDLRFDPALFINQDIAMGKVDLPFDLSLNKKIFGRRELSLDDDGGTEARSLLKALQRMNPCFLRHAARSSYLNFRLDYMATAG